MKQTTLQKVGRPHPTSWNPTDKKTSQKEEGILSPDSFQLELKQTWASACCPTLQIWDSTLASLHNCMNQLLKIALKNIYVLVRDTDLTGSVSMEKSNTVCLLSSSEVCFYFKRKLNALYYIISLVSHSLISDFLRIHELQCTRVFCPWDSPSKNIGMGCLALLQGIFPTHGSNPGLLHHRKILYYVSHQGSPKILPWVFLCDPGSEPESPTL